MKIIRKTKYYLELINRQGDEVCKLLEEFPLHIHRITCGKDQGVWFLLVPQDISHSHKDELYKCERIHD